MISSNSILNDSWYARLLQNVRENANAGIRGTGSRPDDPFWKAREAQGLGDLANQREDARRQAMEAAYGRQAGYAAADKAKTAGIWAKQRAAVANNPQLNGTATYLGTQGDQPAAPGVPDMVEPQAPQLGVPAPVAYGAPNSLAYNPGQFENPVLKRRKSALDEMYARLAKFKGW